MTASPGIRPFAATDLPHLAEVWNQFWASVPRAFTITPEEFETRVLSVLGFPETTLLVAESDGVILGFAHFGPRENGWFLPDARCAPDPKSGVVHALCVDADAQETFAALIEAAENALTAAGANTFWLWPTWAQGAIPFYNGLTPSNEVSGLWSRHPLADWARESGYAFHEGYALGVLPRARALPPASEAAQTAQFRLEPFPTPLVPGAMRLSMIVTDTEAGHVILAPWPERLRATGVNEWATFDVAVKAEFRGKGWGKVLMREAARWVFEEAGAEAVQLHVQLNNPPALALYFRSLGFQRAADLEFVTFRKGRPTQ